MRSDFELRRGESDGLINHNGVGKIALLKLLDALFLPDK
jgi:ABC-type polysaccharide/polyol phosphate transport system ATPase subunit